MQLHAQIRAAESSSESRDAEHASSESGASAPTARLPPTMAPLKGSSANSTTSEAEPHKLVLRRHALARTTLPTPPPVTAFTDAPLSRKVCWVPRTVPAAASSTRPEDPAAAPEAPPPGAASLV